MFDANSGLKKRATNSTRKCNRNFDAMTMLFDYFLTEKYFLAELFNLPYSVKLRFFKKLLSFIS
ncbi:hypothetical protein EBAPG3_14990 [Nitrosospira lacus]|uniref:Uncharacterized protein n=1 Tax=Nitrosospira lacus TaxID=1288494 RepID=A0A1W6SLF0_9PROT|nr:hypothetical protein EBAPG3_14990 [Nitrosospira lacus]